MPESVAAYERLQATLPVAQRDNAIQQYLTKRAILVRSRSPMDVLSEFFDVASKAMILLLPLYALLLKMLYWRRGRSYVEHFVFALHIHSAVFLAASLYLLLPLPHEGAILTLAFFAYGLLALRTVYQQSFVKTVFKAILLFTNYAFVFLVALALTLCFSILV
jgi:hypothetical protein